MKVGIIQSSYIPWRGYFDFIDDVDLFVFYDDVQYTKSDWRNRNRIKTAKGPMWLTVPVNYKFSASQLIWETPIDYSQKWVNRHLGCLHQWYGKAQFHSSYIDSFTEMLAVSYDSISDLNIALSHWAMKHLDITTPTIRSMGLNACGEKSERLIQMLTELNATCYLSGPAAKGYLDEGLFRRNRIRLEYKSYDYPPYPQLWGDFIGEVTVLDMLFNVGPDARRFLKSRVANEVAVP